MARRPKTGFDRYFDARLTDRAFSNEYTAARLEINAIDKLIRALDSAREKQGLTKAALAKKVGMKAELVRRLFTADKPNPTFDTVIRLAGAVNCSVDLVPHAAPRAVARQARR